MLLRDHGSHLRCERVPLCVVQIDAVGCKGLVTSEAKPLAGERGRAAVIQKHLVVVAKQAYPSKIGGQGLQQVFNY